MHLIIVLPNKYIIDCGKNFSIMLFLELHQFCGIKTSETTHTSSKWGQANWMNEQNSYKYVRKTIQQPNIRVTRSPPASYFLHATSLPTNQMDIPTFS